ncbi:MAG: hypothetical protein ABSA86_13065 [Oryzomonas sp.]
MTKTNDCNGGDKSGKIGGKRERQVRGVGKRYRDIGGVMVGNGADRAIIVVVLPVVVVMEGYQQH